MTNPTKEQIDRVLQELIRAAARLQDRPDADELRAADEALLRKVIEAVESHERKYPLIKIAKKGGNIHPIDVLHEEAAQAIAPIANRLRRGEISEVEAVDEAQAALRTLGLQLGPRALAALTQENLKRGGCSDRTLDVAREIVQLIDTDRFHSASHVRNAANQGFDPPNLMETSDWRQAKRSPFRWAYLDDKLSEHRPFLAAGYMIRTCGYAEFPAADIAQQLFEHRPREMPRLIVLAEDPIRFSVRLAERMMMKAPDIVGVVQAGASARESVAALIEGGKKVIVVCGRLEKSVSLEEWGARSGIAMSLIPGKELTAGLYASSLGLPWFGLYPDRESDPMNCLSEILPEAGLSNWALEDFRWREIKRRQADQGAPDRTGI